MPLPMSNTSTTLCNLSCLVGMEVSLNSANNCGRHDGRQMSDCKELDFTRSAYLDSVFNCI